MAQMMIEMMKMITSLLKWPIIFFAIVVFFFTVSVWIWVFVGYFQGKRFFGDPINKLEKRNPLLKIFVDAPKQYAEDMYNRPTDFFREQGLIIFEGRQGKGKSAAMMQCAMDLLDTYPKAKCLSNTAFKYQTAPLKHWKQLINFKNGPYGVIVCMDEMQNWFSSNQSRNFPPEMLGVITQNRKNRRLVLGTSQSFHLLAKSIRSQCTEIRKCTTLAGVITIVIRKEPILNSEGDVIEQKYRGMYFFVHSPRLREAYDTWAVVDSLSESGFQENPPHIRDNPTNVTVIAQVVDGKKSKK